MQLLLVFIYLLRGYVCVGCMHGAEHHNISMFFPIQILVEHH